MPSLAVSYWAHADTQSDNGEEDVAINTGPGSYAVYEFDFASRVPFALMSADDRADYLNAAVGDANLLTLQDAYTGLSTFECLEVRALVRGATPFSLVFVYFQHYYDDGSGWVYDGTYENAGFVKTDANGDGVTGWVTGGFVAPTTYGDPVVNTKFKAVSLTSDAPHP